MSRSGDAFFGSAAAEERRVADRVVDLVSGGLRLWIWLRSRRGDDTTTVRAASGGVAGGDGRLVREPATQGGGGPRYEMRTRAGDAEHQPSEPQEVTFVRPAQRLRARRALRHGAMLHLPAAWVESHGGMCEVDQCARSHRVQKSTSLLVRGGTKGAPGHGMTVA